MYELMDEPPWVGDPDAPDPQAHAQLESELRMPTNDCMVDIGNMSLLEQLEISNAGITDDCLTHLKRLKYLEKLVCCDTELTDSGLEELDIKYKLITNNRRNNFYFG